ncbi:MAG: hypothetical protein SH807_02835 [Blastochloris sp.]|nr:hypothetical protein [Blastochloris sp.]
MNTTTLRPIPNQLKTASSDIYEVSINYMIPTRPLGDVTQSGINRYHGKIGLRFFTNDKGNVIDDEVNETQLYWFPCSQENKVHVEKQFASIETVRA